MMCRRGLAACLVLGLASLANAQTAVISFSPNGGTFAPNQVVMVDVNVTPTINVNKLLRYAQFDFSATSASLRAGLVLPNNHTGVAGGIKGFDFNSVGGANCPAANNANCGIGHYIEDELVGGLRPNIIAMAYTGLTADPTRQITLQTGVARKIAVLQLTMPGAPGNYGKLDVLNAAGAGSPDLSGELRWSFGVASDNPANELIRLRAGAGLSGGVSNDFIVSPPGCVNLMASLPGKTAATNTAGVLSRTTRNEVRMDFSGNLPALPAGGVRVREMQVGGGFGGDLSASFTGTITDTPGGGVDTARLILKDNGTTLVHRRWYQVDVADTYPGVCNFCLQFVVQAGDCQLNNSVNAADLTCINGKVPTLPAAAATDANFTSDINAVTGISAADLSAANAQIPSAPVNRPAGHVPCP